MGFVNTIQLTTILGVLTQGGLCNQPPVFTSKLTITGIPQSLPVNSTIFSTVEVTDSDGDNNTMPITVTCITSSGSAVDPCSIVGVITTISTTSRWQGSLILLQHINQQMNPLVVPLQATDGRDITDVNVTIAVTVTPAIFLNLSTTNVTRTAVIGTVVFNVSAQPQDNPVSYTLLNRNGYFALNKTSGAIQVLQSLMQASSPITLQVQACLLSNQSCTTSVLTINLKDNQPPVFSSTGYSGSVVENALNGTPVIENILVTDPEQGIYGNMTLSLSQYGDIFSINPVEGQSFINATITLADSSILNSQTQYELYTFQVIATESFSPDRLNSSVQVVVNVKGVNSHYPQFKQPSYSALLSETTAPGTVVINITATDPDRGVLGTAGIRYKLTGIGAQLFQCNLRTGLVTVAPCVVPGQFPCLDFETKPVFNLTFVARDNLGEGLETDVPLTIRLINVNDNPPAFNQAAYFSNITEDQTVPNPPVQVQATDPDNNTLTYGIVGGDPGNAWQIGPTNGIVTATRPVDYAAIPGGLDRYELTLMASDGLHNVTTQVTIVVQPINKFAPVFQSGLYIQTIREDTPPGTSIERLLATDGDPISTPNGVVRYQIISGSADQFVMNATSGVVSVATNSSLNYVIQNRYNMTILAYDGGQPSKTATATLIVHLLNTNNRSPFFQPSTVRQQIREDAVVGTPVITMTASDPDPGAVLIYYISDTSQNPIRAFDPNANPVDRNQVPFQLMFAIGRSSGIVTVSATLNYDLVATYMAVILAVDTTAQNQTATATLIMSIIQVNNEGPIFGLPWTPNNTRINITVAEGQPPGTYVTTLSATSTTNYISGYAIISDPGQNFQVNPYTGVVAIKTPLDYETEPRTEFVLIATDTDQPPKTSTVTVNVYILNINDNSPQFNQSMYWATIGENSPGGTPVITVAATDKDLGDYGAVRYTVIDDNFAIGSVTGLITVRPGAVLNRQFNPGPFTFVVITFDSPNEPGVRRFAFATVYVNLTDVNDNVPIFQQDPYNATIPSTAPVNTTVIRVTATDSDVPGPNSNITYSISPNPYFTVDPVTGVIITTSKLPPNGTKYNVSVTASDHGLPVPLSSNTTVLITVVATTPDQSPRWITPPPNNGTVATMLNENEPPKVLVYQARAVSNIIGGQVEYYFSVNNTVTSTTDAFEINPITGVITTRVSLDKQDNPQYLLLLVAQEMNYPSLQSRTYLIVLVGDINDIIPEFPKNANCCAIPYVFTVAENVPVNYSIGTVVATFSNNSVNTSVQLLYTLSGNNAGDFRLDRKTGQVFVQNPLNSDRTAFYNLTVIAGTVSGASSTGVAPGCTCAIANSVLLYITVTPVDDHAPTLAGNSFHYCVSDEAVFGTVVTTLGAVDLDTNQLPGFFFRLVRLSNFPSKPNFSPIPASNDTFLLGLTSGVLSCNALMMDYTGEFFRLEVQVADRGGLASQRQVTVSVVAASEEVTLTFNQPPSIIEQMKDSIAQQISDVFGGAVVCIGDIRYYVDGSTVDVTRTQMTLYVLYNDTYFTPVSPGVITDVVGKSGILGPLAAQAAASASIWSGFVTNGVLAALIIIFILWLLAVLAILFICLCWSALCPVSHEEFALTTWNPFGYSAGNEEQELTMNVKTGATADGMKADHMNGDVVDAGHVGGFLHTRKSQYQETQYHMNGSAGGGYSDGLRIEAPLVSATAGGATSLQIPLLQAAGRMREADDGVSTAALSTTSSGPWKQRIGATLVRPFGATERVLGENYSDVGMYSESHQVEYSTMPSTGVYRTLPGSQEVGPSRMYSENTMTSSYPDDVFTAGGEGPFVGLIRIRSGPSGGRSGGSTKEFLTSEVYQEMHTEHM